MQLFQAVDNRHHKVVIFERKETVHSPCDLPDGGFQTRMQETEAQETELRNQRSGSRVLKWR